MQLVVLFSQPYKTCKYTYHYLPWLLLKRQNTPTNTQTNPTLGHFSRQRRGGSLRESGRLGSGDEASFLEVLGFRFWGFRFRVLSLVGFRVLYRVLFQALTWGRERGRGR